MILIDEKLKDTGKFVKLVEKEVSKQLSGVHLPVGAVVAFAKKDCPKGWAPYNKAEGRFIIGVGKGPLSAPVLIDQAEGKEMMTLKENHLPSHQHGTMIWVKRDEEEKWARKNKTAMIGWGFGYASGKNMFGLAGPRIRDGNHFLTEAKGDSEPFNIMPPYIALRFCQNPRK